jgi:SHS family lactate transporter-like MFS transporter
MPADTISITSIDVELHNRNIIRPPKFDSATLRRYFGSRFSSLFVTKEERAQFTWNEILNPFHSIHEVTLKQWNFFALGLCAWTWDAFDFFTTTLNVVAISKDMDRSVQDITWGITLVLMFRSVGAVFMGIWADTKGRKWPYIFNLTMLIIIQIGTGFVQTYAQFIALRALFGIAMGGLFGLCAAEALSDLPKNARGVLSGLFQEGYALGYLIAVIFERAIADTTTGGWRNIFFFSAGPPVLFILWRFFTPETDAYLRQKAQFDEKAIAKNSAFKEFKHEFGKAVKQYWLIMIYCVIMMAGFNFMSHGSQDMYPTMLTSELGYGPDKSTVTNVIANLGAILGGFVFGHLSQFIGRRLSIIIACVLGGAMIYPWAFVKSSGLNAGVFFLQAGVQGAWGVIPIHLNELAPPQFRSLVTGLSYQLGNLASSAASTIEARISKRFPIVNHKGVHTYDYSKTMAIFIACVFTYVIIVVFFGPEYRGAALSVERDEVVSKYDTDGEYEAHVDANSKEGSILEKADAKHVEGDPAKAV